MTIQQAMQALELIAPGSLSTQAQLAALSQLESAVYAELVSTHEGGEGEAFAGFTADTGFETALRIPAPYDQMYVYWLLSQADLANNEIDRYQNSAGLFNQAWGACVRWYNRTHRPLGATGFSGKEAAV